MAYNKDYFIYKEKKENKKEKYIDYYFITIGSVKEQIMKENYEYGAIGINDIIYCYPDDEVVVQFVFTFNISYYKIENEEIKNILKEIVLRLEEDE